MQKVTNSEELKIRLEQASGETIVACGWGTLGVKNVLVGVTSTALFLEFISFTLKSKDVKRIPFEDLEFISPVTGEAVTPKLLKMNLNAQINDALTGTLVFKSRTDRLTYLTFRKMPGFDCNNKAPFRITECISASKPELVHMPDLKNMKEPGSKAGCFRRFLLITLVLGSVLTLLFGLFMDQGWEMAATVGLATAVVFGGVFAPLIPMFKTMFTGHR